jgi:hypothetical protein
MGDVLMPKPKNVSNANYYYDDVLERVVEAYLKRRDPDADPRTLELELDLLATLHVSKMAKNVDSFACRPARGCRDRCSCAPTLVD